MQPTALLTAALLALTLTGCGGDDEPTAADPTTTPTTPIAVGTLQGTIITSGGPLGTEPMAWEGTVRIAGADGAVTTAETGDTGRFAIQLAPGDYTVTATSPSYNGGRGTCSTDPAVTRLRADAVTEVEVVCPLR